jgi:hypothetical protein
MRTLQISAAAPPSGQAGGVAPAPRRPTPRSRNADSIGQSTGNMQQTDVQLALAAQAARFDAMMKVLAEQQREINAIVDLGMAQTKRDDQLMNEWIRLI